MKFLCYYTLCHLLHELTQARVVGYVDFIASFMFTHACLAVNLNASGIINIDGYSASLKLIVSYGNVFLFLDWQDNDRLYIFISKHNADRKEDDNHDSDADANEPTFFRAEATGRGPIHRFGSESDLYLLQVY